VRAVICIYILFISDTLGETEAERGGQGDGDPIDVVEVGSAVLETGAVRAVKPLGVLCMIDDGEAGETHILFMGIRYCLWDSLRLVRLAVANRLAVSCFRCLCNAAPGVCGAWSMMARLWRVSDFI